MSDLAEFAPAKVNLYLHVVGRRPDGYHLLESLVVFAGVGDRLTMSPSDELSLSITGPFAAGLRAEPNNLVLRAARELAIQAGIPATGALLLEKNLPVASGIGGGSADAAATLRLLCRVWRLDPDSIASLAGRLGADVPVCLAGRPMMMSGIGDVLAPAPKLPRIGIVLVNPGVAVSTQSVFRTRKQPFSKVTGLSGKGWQDVAALVYALRSTRNDLQPTAQRLAPAIQDVLDTLAAVPHCLLARMSGSGATCFGLFPTVDAAREAARATVRDGWWVWGGDLAVE